MLRTICVLFVSLVVSGCALIEAETDISYAPSLAASQVTGAQSVTVAVAVNDSRVSNRDRISVKKNGYGMEMASIRSSRDVPDMVRNAIELELLRRGFVLGGGPVFVVVEVNKFWNDFKSAFFTASAVGEVMLSIQVRNAAGELFHAKSYIGEGKVEPIMMFEADNAREALEKAFANAVGELLADPVFIDALLKARQKSVPSA